MRTFWKKFASLQARDFRQKLVPHEIQSVSDAGRSGRTAD